MREEKGIKNIYLCTMSVLLTVAVILTSVPFYSFQAEALADNTQTGYSDVVEYQTERWNTILEKVFAQYNQDGGVKKITSSSVTVPDKNADLTLNEDNGYFNWHTFSDEDGVIPWDGNTKEVTSRTEIITYEADSTVNGKTDEPISKSAVNVTYTVYDVRNASELYYAYSEAEKNFSSQNTKINLLNDIDLNGAEKIWEGKCFNGNHWLYIEGNGYTIYNMRTYNTKIVSGSYGNGAFLGGSLGNTRLIMKNLNFSNCLSLSAGANYATAVAVSVIMSRAYLENVNVKNSFVYSGQDQTGTLMGREEGEKGNVFVRNCSSQNCYVFGDDHSGGLTGCQHNYGTKYQAKYNVEFPSSPEVWMSDDTASANNAYFPEIVENCYSVNCEVFSVGPEGDSGGLISCGGKFICRNSFTNNIIYGRTRTGNFLGRIVTLQSGANGLYDDKGNRGVEIYFENCFASGTVEGTQEIGGFVGFDSGLANAGVAVYKNCYSTAMVGMDFAGNRLGGFVGFENTTSSQKASIKIGTDENGSPLYNDKSGAVYINCYAAGEVGNTLTDTSTSQTGTYDYLGGFLGEVGFKGYVNDPNDSKIQIALSAAAGNATLNNGTYVNCYYDVQTTAMHERACGRADCFADCFETVEKSQIPGVTGVYTQHSDKKEVQGLTDTVDMGNSFIGITDAYPLLSCFYGDAADRNFGTFVGENDTYKESASADPTAVYASTVISTIKAQLTEKAETVKKYALASVSTVLLDHWDSTMNMLTGTLDSEIVDWSPGLERNKLTQADYQEGEKWEDDDDGKYWYIDYNNLAAGEYVFKIQQGDSWAYNFGSDSFNGSDCTLDIKKENCDVRIMFDYAGSVSAQGNNTPFRIWAKLYYDDGTEELLELGTNTNVVTSSLYTVVGSFNSWLFSDDYDMNYLGNNKYSLSVNLSANTDDTYYEFKIAKDHAWTVSYGMDGNDNNGANMTFTLTEDCKVTFLFDDDTHLTAVTADKPDALIDVVTESDPIVFEGYSVIAHTTITGHDWLDSQAAVEDGAMTDVGNGIYEKSFTITGEENFNKNYGYKVIKDALDVGSRSYFYLLAPSNGDNKVTLTFQYNSKTDETKVISSPPNLVSDVNVAYYSVLGTEDLTGYNWGTVFNSETQEWGDIISGVGTMTPGDDKNVWSRTYEDVPAGSHAFKVTAGNDFQSGIEYGANDGSGNYIFITDKTSDVTITLDTSTGYISVTTDPADARVMDRYVVSGTSNLVNSETEWSTTDVLDEMEYDEITGTYKITYTDLETNSEESLSFKVAQYGKSGGGDNISLYISGAVDEKYSLEITYFPNSKKTEYTLYDALGNDVTEDYLSENPVSFYSVLGDEGLTGYNWAQDEDGSLLPEAVEAGTMVNDGERYSVTFSNVAIGSTQVYYGFKIVPNGSWSMGYSYGSADGSNYTVALASDTYTKCDVTITFDPVTYEIGVSVSPEGCLVEEEIDEASFIWYVAGDAGLISDNAFIAPETIYDTVRDITSTFTFTSGVGMNWSIDSERNKSSGFFQYLGTDTDTDNTGFTVGYDVDNHHIDYKFNVPVINLIATPQEGYTAYSCDKFMPGKQWLSVSVNNSALSAEYSIAALEDITVDTPDIPIVSYVSDVSDVSDTPDMPDTPDTPDTSVSTESLAGERDIRLIPTIYLEAGTDAKIRVLQSGNGSSASKIENVVTYNGIVDQASEKTINFSYYNFALTAGYLISDRTGLAYYGNYSKQTVVPYNESKLRKNDVTYDSVNHYFAMYSVFTQGASYSDAVADDHGLSVDTLEEQSLIGNSYDNRANKDEENTSYAQTIVKITKQVDNGDGTYSYNKVFTSTEATNTEYYKNYLKWTGQRPFEASDEGEYVVTYYWSLSDGRYITDSKNVSVQSNLCEIEKTVDKKYFEKADNNAEIEYTVTYTNRVDGDFEIYDVFPYDKDIRYNNTAGSTVSEETSFELKDVSVNIVQGENSTCQTDETYYTTEAVQMNEAGTGFEKEPSSWSPYSGSVSEATALKITGSQSGTGKSTITITYTLAVNDPERADYYVNNSFFKVTDRAAGNILTDCSSPVTTAVVGRELSGYVWLDLDADGIYDSDEPPIQDVIVKLMKKNTDGTYSEVTSQSTPKDGYYCFSDIYAQDGIYSNYRVEFSAASDVTVMYSAIDESKSDVSINFSSLYQSRVFSMYYTEDINKSRNIARAEKNANGEYTGIYYIDENLPTASEIYAHNKMQLSYGMVTDHYYSRKFQNLALSEDELGCSITINKVDDNNEPLAGVKFTLEKSVNGEWRQIVNDGSVDGTFITDSNGQIVIDEISTGDYRITEVSTLEGYNLLTSSVELTLPYTVDKDNNVVDSNPTYITPTDSESPDKSDDKYDYYNAVTVKVVNTKKTTLPTTGADGKFAVVFIGVVIALAGVGVLMFVRGKKKKSDITNKKS